MRLLPTSGKISIQQGVTGNCYLLASLDALLNGEPAFRQSLSQRFKVLPDASVEVWLEKGDGLHRPKVDKLNDKYHYRFDETSQQHVITVPKTQVQRMLGETGGVTTNAFVVILLEHLLPYFFKGDWCARGAIQDSVKAHDFRERFDEGSTSTQFVASLLGLNLDEKPESDIETVIESKLRHPETPVYISMAWGEKDAFGRYHGRHALNLVCATRITAGLGGDGNIKLFFQNPHNNSKLIAFTLEEVKARSPRCAVFSLLPKPRVMMMPREARPPAVPVRRRPDVLPPPLPFMAGGILPGEPVARGVPLDFILWQAYKQAAHHLKSGTETEKVRAYVHRQLTLYLFQPIDDTLEHCSKLLELFETSKGAITPIALLMHLPTFSSELTTIYLKQLVISYMLSEGLQDKAKAQLALKQQLICYQETQLNESLTEIGELRALVVAKKLAVETLLETIASEVVDSPGPLMNAAGAGEPMVELCIDGGLTPEAIALKKLQKKIESLGDELGSDFNPRAPVKPGEWLLVPKLLKMVGAESFEALQGLAKAFPEGNPAISAVCVIILKASCALEALTVLDKVALKAAEEEHQAVTILKSTGKLLLQKTHPGKSEMDFLRMGLRRECTALLRLERDTCFANIKRRLVPLRSSSGLMKQFYEGVSAASNAIDAVRGLQPLLAKLNPESGSMRVGRRSAPHPRN